MCLVENIQGKFKIAFASTGDCLELFASEGDFVTSGREQSMKSMIGKSIDQSMTID